jgi:cobalt/nickel transport protein
MKKYLVVVALIIVFLIVFLPLASTNPDGLEKVASSFGAQEHESLWGGLMADYTFSLIKNMYASTLIAGIFGIVMVLVATLILGKVLIPNNKKTK